MCSEGFKKVLAARSWKVSREVAVLECYEKQVPCVYAECRMVLNWFQYDFGILEDSELFGLSGLGMVFWTS